MGRAIVREPQVFLMDEPLSNLDAKLRVQTRTQIAALQRRLDITTLYVTHDQVEAMTMGDRVAVLKDGILQQCDTPRAMYDTPDNVFVAGFIGSPQMNLVEATLVDGGAQLAERVIPIAREKADAAAAEGAKTVTLGFRPEDLTVTDGSTGVPVQAIVVEELGADAYVYGELTQQDGNAIDVIVRVNGRTPPAKGETIHVAIQQGHEHVFSTVSGKRL